MGRNYFICNIFNTFFFFFFLNFNIYRLKDVYYFLKKLLFLSISILIVFITSLNLVLKKSKGPFNFFFFRRRHILLLFLFLISFVKDTKGLTEIYQLHQCQLLFITVCNIFNIISLLKIKKDMSWVNAGLL